VALTALSSLLPAASRMAFRFSSTRTVLLGDATRNELSSGRIQRNLAGCEKKIADADSLRIRADGGGGGRCCDDGFWHDSI